MLRMGLGALAFAGIASAAAVAQSPNVHEPFYREETARRQFFDALLVRADVGISSSPSPSRPMTGTGLQTVSPLSLGLQLEGRLWSRSSWGTSWDLLRRLQLSTPLPDWIWIRYYWRVEETDYALRVAFDPIPGQSGFRRVDVAFLSSTDLSPQLGSDFAIGFRSLSDRYGYALFSDSTWAPLSGGLGGAEEQRNGSIVEMGREVRLQQVYLAYLDPARSALFAGLQATAGHYTLLRRYARPDSTALPVQQEHLRGLLWLRLGGRWARPAWSVGGYVAIPLYQHPASRVYGPELGLQLLWR